MRNRDIVYFFFIVSCPLLAAFVAWYLQALELPNERVKGKVEMATKASNHNLNGMFYGAVSLVVVVVWVFSGRGSEVWVWVWVISKACWNHFEGSMICLVNLRRDWEGGLRGG